MANAARVGDQTAHPGVISGPGATRTYICGQLAAVIGTPHACSFPGPAPHPPSTIIPGPGPATKVLIEGRPAARVGDMSACGAPILPPGAPTVYIG
jgi:uncharacterized Zn-binding protein involved in type VI secretion